MSPQFLSILVGLAAMAGGGAEPGHLQEVGAFRGTTVTTLYQDRVGFLWVGTREGLVLYDGAQTRLFDHDVARPDSISGNTVRVIYEDAGGRLWIGTNSAGLNRLDRSTGSFHSFRHDAQDPRSLSHDSIYAIAEDTRGALWVGTQVGLNRLDPETGLVRRYRSDPGNPTTLCGDYVYGLYKDSRGDLWVGTVGGGLGRLDAASESFTCFRHASAERGLPEDQVFAWAEDPRGFFWVGTGAGLETFHPATGGFRAWEPPDGGAHPLRKAIVTSLTFGPDGSLFAGTLSQGLYRLDPVSGRARLVPTGVGRPGSAGAHRTVAVLSSREGNVWVAAWSGGLFRLVPASDVFSFLPLVGAEPQEIKALEPSGDGSIWVGTWGGGLYRMDPETGGTLNLPVGDPSLLRRVSVLDLEEDREGRLWVGSMGTLLRMDPRRRRVVTFAHDPRDPSSLGPGYVTAVLEDHQGRLWVGTGEGGLNLFDGRGFQRFPRRSDIPGSLSDDYVTVIREGTPGVLWVGTRSGGLNRCEGVPPVCRSARPDPGDPASLSHHYVTDILVDSAGAVWVATDGGGVNRLRDPDPQDGFRFDRFTEREGLLDDGVVALAQDEDGTLWVAARSGLSRLRPGTGEVVNYTAEDGLPPVRLNSRARVRTGGRILVGAPDGILGIRAGAAFPAVAPSPTVITDVRTVQGPVRRGRAAWDLERVTIPYREPISFEFAVLDFGDPRRHRFRYRLRGLDDRWVDLGERSEVTLTGLRPGRYVMELRGRNHRGVWSNGPVALELEVAAPFWMQSWFHGLLLASLMVTAVLVHWLRTSALERRNRELAALKEARERALDEARASHRASNLANRRLRELSRRLEQVREDERRHLARELHDEMGQALSAAKINLQLLKQRLGSDGSERAGDAIRLLDRMIQHVRQLSVDLRPPLLDELGLEAALRGYAETQAARARLQVRFDAEGSLRGLAPEVSITAFRLIQEALTNVIRHAGATQVQVSVKRANGSLEIRVSDDGSGFDPSAAMHEAGRGGHLGLLGMQERAEGLGGTVSVQSRPGSGTVVRAVLPAGDAGEES